MQDRVYVKSSIGQCCSSTASKNSKDREKTFSVCLKCKNVFSDKYLLIEHFKTHHKISHDDSYLFLRDIPWRCMTDCKRICGESSKNACICMVCKKTFVNKYTCITHINTYHNVSINSRSLDHEEWYRSLSDEKELNYVENDETSNCRNTDDPYSCCLCGKVLSRKSSCLRHLRNQHQIDNEKFCEEPLSLCRKLDTIAPRSSQSVAKFLTKTACLLCYKVFQKKYNCFQHLLRKHEKDVKSLENSSELFVEFNCKNMDDFKETGSTGQTKDKKNTKKTSYQCHICAKLLISASSLKRHMSIHRTPPQFTCNVCQKKFHRRNSLKHHEDFVHRLHHQIICHICKKAFSTPLTLKQHEMIHTGEKPFRCDLCLKNFRLKSTLLYHMKIHSGERPFQCHFCQKYFKSRTDCKNHERVHTLQRPFNCRQCGKDFGHSSARYKHEKSHEKL